MPDEGKSGGACDTCLARRAPYPNNLSNSTGWSFWGSSKSTTSTATTSGDCSSSSGGGGGGGGGCGGGAGKGPSSADGSCSSSKEAIEKECKSDRDKCQNLTKNNTEFKTPSGGACPPMPPPECPALCRPAWLSCPANITIAPYPAPKGVEIRPISEGGRNNKCEGGKCSKCGVEKAGSSGPPRVSPTCPMMKPKCMTAKTAAEADKGKNGGKDGNFLSKITSMFSMFGGKDKK